MTKPNRILLVGTGGIAAHHIEEFSLIPNCNIVACVDSVPERVEAFAKKHRISRSFTSLHDALGWGQFEAAINATPDAAHKETTLALIAAGKHVFCEKPLAPNYGDALEMTEAAEKAGIVNMVNLTYRNSPALQEARAMVRAGELGKIYHVWAAYRQSWLVSKAWGDWRTEDKWLWRLSTKHGSTGVLGDVGIHILDFATYVADDTMVALKADMSVFPKIEGNRIGEYELDANDTFGIVGRLTNGALIGVRGTRLATGHLNDLSLAIHGSKGALQAFTNGKKSKLRGCFGSNIDHGRWEKLELPPVERNAQRFAAALESGKNGKPSFRRAADLQRIIDAAFASNKDSGKLIILKQ